MAARVASWFFQGSGRRQLETQIDTGEAVSAVPDSVKHPFKALS